MRLVYTAQSLAIVQNVLNALEANGIPGVLRNQHLNAGEGQLPPIECWPEVWVVDDADAERAEEFIDAALHATGARKVPWRCERCGARVPSDFGECWKCGAAS